MRPRDHEATRGATPICSGHLVKFCVTNMIATKVQRGLFEACSFLTRKRCVVVVVENVHSTITFSPLFTFSLIFFSFDYILPKFLIGETIQCEISFLVIIKETIIEALDSFYFIFIYFSHNSLLYFYEIPDCV